MSQEFNKLKRESKIYIINNRKTSNRKLMAKIIEKFNNPVSYKYIGDFKNSSLFSQINSQLSQKIPKNIPRKNNGGTKRGTKKFHLTYSGFLQLCKKNPHHPFSQYFLERNQPPKYPGRAELMKVLQVLEDCYRMWKDIERISRTYKI